MPDYSRRQVIQSALLGAVAAPAGAVAGSAADGSLRATLTAAITHGPMLGTVTATSVRVWIRTRRPARFEVLYALHENLNDAQKSAVCQTEWAQDCAGWLELRGLEPGRRYYYAILVDGVIADTRLSGVLASFRTLKDAAAYRHSELNPDGLFNFAFEVGSCNDQSWRTTRQNLPPTYAVMRRKLAGRIDFQILNGDWIYEDGRDVTAEQWAASNQIKKLPRAVQLATGLTGVWENYKRYLDACPDLSYFYRETPMFVTLDDHEILNDVTGTGQSGFRTDARGKPFQKDIASRTDFDSEVERAVFRDPAEAAWEDYVGWTVPSNGARQRPRFGQTSVKVGSTILTDRKADFTTLDPSQTSNLHILWGFGNTGVYDIVEVLGPHELRLKEPFNVTETVTYSIGNQRFARFSVGNSDFFLLDARSNRTAAGSDASGKKRTDRLLGAVQKVWLHKELKSSQAQFLFIVSPVNVVLAHDNGAWYGQGTFSEAKNDGWVSELEERAELLAIAESLGRPVIFLSADLHRSFMARIAPGVYDVGTGPHSSRVHRLGDSGGAPPNGWYQSGDRLVNILWSSAQYRNDSNRDDRRPGNDWPIYTVVRVNNAYNVPDEKGADRWIAYPEPQLVFEFYDGFTGELVWANSVSATETKPNPEPVPLERVKVLGGIRP